MDLQTKKLTLIERLIWLSDTTTISKIDKLLNKTIKEKYEAKLKPMTDAQYKARLDKAEYDFKKGNVTAQSDMEKEIQNW